MGRKMVNKFTFVDFIIMIVIIILCLTCILPFLHILSKSISDSAHVLAKQVYFWPKDLNFEAYISIFKDGQLTHAMLYSILVTVIFTVLGGCHNGYGCMAFI